MKRIAVLGSTGSIGMQTLDVARQHADKLEVVFLSAHKNVEALAKQVEEFLPKYVVLTSKNAENDSAFGQLKSFCVAHHIELACGEEALLDTLALSSIDTVVNAIVGFAGMRASYKTLQEKKQLALANKESLVVAGDLLMPLARVSGEHQHVNPELLVPIDSEHGAIFQCLIGEAHAEVAQLLVTASGGPFFGRTHDELLKVTAKDALKHPTWNMGAKISIDSSTLMNKGLEVIEAHHLFSVPFENIEVVVQRQSVIHSMVEFVDGSVKAHLGTTDMRIPIQFALSWPTRWEAPVAPLNFQELGSIDFAAPDTKTFPCLRLAYEAGSAKGVLPCAMNAANEVAVDAFLHDSCGFLDIPLCIEHVLSKTPQSKVESIDQLVEVDGCARTCAQEFLAHKNS